MGSIFKPKTKAAPPAPEAPAAATSPVAQELDLTAAAKSTAEKNKRRLKLSDTVNTGLSGGSSIPQLRDTLG